ncbi:MAG: UDP-3-O-acyl-N-acetylglucosamine deacetylase, partial [Halobacteriovoraceae bacterium]|nr:UDP-3-O-acyl-N-acetylglucosamine deacetylase [Halobacteriovoraceae bacterium]
MEKKPASGKTQILYQRTLGRKTEVVGIGIHSGKKVTLTLHPAKADFGIQFKRTDIPNAPLLKAHAKTVGATESNTTLGVGENSIHTVEHLLAVFYGLGIDNIYCEIDGPEIPIMDGSGASFIFLLKETGITTLLKPKNFIVILEPVKVNVGDKWAEFSPSPRLKIDSTVIFSHPMIKTQKYEFEFSCENFVRQIGRARTFGMLKDVDMLRRKGLIKGGSLENAIVLDDFKVINREGLRFKDEFVRHKILDIIGDISLLGHEVAGKITTFKSGHNLH